TQKWVRWIMRNKYGTGYDGLDGNDDGGTLSAWYVLSALGIYPMAGTDKYQIGSPLFNQAELNLRETKLRIIAENNSKNNVYINTLEFNGRSIKKHWLSHQEIVSGGELKFTMTGKPISNRQNQQESLK
ncbi:MAG: glycoside hydrolase family 92 protein, partial [Calditrichales bacterium]